MHLTAKEVAQMIDLSCVRTTSNKADIADMVTAARQYGCQCPALCHHGVQL